MPKKSKQKLKHVHNSPSKRLHRHAKKLGLKIVQMKGISPRSLDEAVELLEGARRTLPYGRRGEIMSTNSDCSITLITRNRF